MDYRLWDSAGNTHDIRRNIGIAGGRTKVVKRDQKTDMASQGLRALSSVSMRNKYRGKCENIQKYNPFFLRGVSSATNYQYKSCQLVAVPPHLYYFDRIKP